MEQPTHTAAEIALDFAMQCVVDAARPWSVSASALRDFRSEFATDFKQEITDLDAFRAWQPRLERLFDNVGGMARFAAEAWQHDVSCAPGCIGLLELWLAAQAVRLLVCPTQRHPARRLVQDTEQAKICDDVAPFQEAELEKLLNKALEVVTRMLRP